MNLLKNSFPAFAALLLAATLSAQQPNLLSAGEWSSETVADGITLRQAAFAGNLFGANQYLCVLEVAPGARFDIVPSAADTLELTSDLARQAGAAAAVNGSFFNMRPPYGSVNYLRVDGADVAPNAITPGRYPGSGRNTRQTGAVATFRGELFIVKADDLRSWEKYIAAEDVLTAGPMLLAGGSPEAVAADSFNKTRHPRTAVGRRADGTVLLVTADGRSEQAAGLSMEELQQLMTALGCTDAINLDGGGSTAMVIGGAVVNHPSDNRTFDAAGERIVANAICVKAK